MKKSFIQYLEEKWPAEGVLDDDMPDAFNAWLESLDTQDIINYAESALIEAYDLMDLKVQEAKDTYTR